MEETLSSTNTSTKQQWIAEQARAHPERVFTSLHHLIDIDWMREAFRRTRKDGASGVDGMTAADYEADLEANLEDLLNRLKSGCYRAPPVRRHHIPKADGTKRPLGIPTFEDKVAQRAILMLVEPLYEQDFLPCSYGFRPGRSAHDALGALRMGIMEQGHRWVIDADLANYFGSIDHGHLRSFLDLRIKDGVVSVVRRGILTPYWGLSASKIDGVDASSRRHRSVPRWWCDQPPEEEASMEQVNIIGIDLAKRSFQLHGARADGSVAFRRKVSREKLLYFLAALPRCVVAMEACASAHHWGREIMQLGHDVRLIPPIYVKPFVKRQKNDAADAEAICEAAQRPTMRFVAVKGEEQQARAMLFHTRDLLVRQRTQTINALRGHLAEFGVVAPQGVAHVGRLASALEDPGSGLPGAVRALGGVLLGQIADLDAKIGGLEKELRACARQDEQAARLMTIPGIGPISAMALQAFAPPMESFRRGRDFSAWLGLVPRQHTTGGKPRLGRISKMGQRDLRRLLIIGAMAVVSSAVRRGETNDPWLARMLARKPRMLVAVALANKMARIVWVLMTRKETYRGFAPAAA